MQPRRLLLVRHAQAAAGSIDENRPLTDEGARGAAVIGSWLAQEGMVPGRVLVSPARRAAQTWELAAASLSSDPQPVFDQRIYDNTAQALLAAIRETPEEVQVVAVVGHNPSMAELALLLDDGRGAARPRSDVAAGFRAGGVAVFELTTPFTGIGPGTATLSAYVVPGR
jgi:phosphohistidine phosphatase